jgi:hypothetical protein
VLPDACYRRSQGTTPEGCSACLDEKSTHGTP